MRFYKSQGRERPGPQIISDNHLKESGHFAEKENVQATQGAASRDFLRSGDLHGKLGEQRSLLGLLHGCLVEERHGLRHHCRNAHIQSAVAQVDAPA